ncbi:hypothetical protein I5M32_15785 [Pedobacter sp. SD-b]|uniref:Right handed beta helix region n=1 Tax=Pedobacter segetis TaxID=2793069 RepID=A0ABS1BNX4_9SPHI|nr:hypothetical protein [Pedobacter segetis]MBK0384426.1 hypothetical protein [Pedobacter segetis]
MKKSNKQQQKIYFNLSSWFLISVLIFAACKKNKTAFVEPSIIDTIKTTIIDSTSNYISDLRVGDPSITFKSTSFDDTNFPEMREWVKAGVTGGIPEISATPIKLTLNAINSAGLQTAINSVSQMGGGQIFLNAGTYTIDATVQMKNKVRLVGIKDLTIFNITIRTAAMVTAYGIDFNNASNAGLDNLTIQYDGGGITPIPSSYANNQPTFYVSSVYLHGGTKNSWIQNCSFLNIGNSPLVMYGTSYVTIRDCYVDGGFNKGDSGSGYFGIGASSYVLCFNNTIKKYAI